MTQENALAKNKTTETLYYDDDISRKFFWATVWWALIAIILGVLIASQLAEWRLNFNLPWLTFGRLRPLHTNAAIFAFGGNAIFAGVYYSTQRLLRTRMYSDVLSRVHFWGWQLAIVLAVITLPLGISVSKEYAELEWPVAHLVTAIWVVFAVNFFATLMIRRVKHIYVAIWFYIATIITVAVLHVVNTINIPVTFFKSYPIFSGVQDAMVQWWYGHNAVAFFLTTPFLGLMYYFLPKAAERPVYSYRLSIVHFWSLVFVYIWAGPHHLLYTALPDWAQTLGMVFSVALIAPSWGGMINGLLTMKGAWHRVRAEPILKFFVAALTFYGMATFEGPLLSIKSVNSLAHYTDWIIGHVHSGALGWNGFLSFGMIYWLVPKLWKRKLYSDSLANFHFWLGMVGLLMYIISMWVSGITQGSMLLATDEAGKLLYPDFVVTLTKIIPLYWVRAAGGGLYLIGVLLMIFNIFKTIFGAEKRNQEITGATEERLSSGVLFEKRPNHRILEGLPTVFGVLTLLAILIGTFIELFPTFWVKEFAYDDLIAMGKPLMNVKPYTPLELEGRDLYVREGCYNCHSQMIRQIPSEVTRYGAYSRPEESRYDFPFQWGSKRTGPDLARVGGKYPDLWHYRHMYNPREINSGSNMPAYPWLFDTSIRYSLIKKKIAVMKTLGVPYSEEDIELAEQTARLQAKRILQELQEQGADKAKPDTEIVALIAYLQRLGKDHREQSQ